MDLQVFGYLQVDLQANVMYKANKDLDAHAEAHPDDFCDPRRYHECPECGRVYFGTICGCKKVGM